MTLWPASVRLVGCAVGLWGLALLAPGPWVLLAAPVLGGLGFACVRRDRGHHLGVGLIIFACLATIQITVLTAAHGSDRPAETAGIVVGATPPGPSEWSRLTLVSGVGLTEVLAPGPVAAGAHVSMRTEALERVRITREQPRVTRAPNALWRWREEVRAGLREDALAAGHGGGALLPGLVVGDTGPQDAQMVEEMRVVSLVHLSAVSGTNVSIVSLGAGLLAGACRAGPRTRVSVGVLTCLGYVFIVGFEPSAIRAAGMAMAVAIVFLRGGGISPVAVIAGTVSLLLTLVPVLATSVGFVLSVVSTSAIMFVAPIVLRRLMVRFRVVPAVLLSALVVPLVAQLACTPVLVAIDPRLAEWSVVANALAAPAVLPATIAGFLSLVTGGIGVLGGIGVPEVPGLAGVPGLPGVAAMFAWLAEFCAWLGALCAWWIVAVARVFAALPGAALPWPEPPLGTLLALLFLAVLTVGGVLLMSRRLWGAPVIVVGLVLVATVVVIGSPRPPARDWLVLVCDVGQGSATVVNLGGGRGLVIDTGKTPGPIDVCLDESGITDLRLVISHFDADHSAGYAGTTWARTVTEVWVSANVAAGPDVARLAADTDAEVVPLSRGAESDLRGVGVEVLWPPVGRGVGAGVEAGSVFSDAGGGLSDAGGGFSDAGGGPSLVGGGPSDSETAARNEDSLVLRLDFPELSVLVPGDIGEEEQFILAQSLEPVDVLLAPHHGSSDLSADFYAAARPRLGVVSVGENRYGHPTPSSLQAFGPVPVLRTDQCGTIAVYADARSSTARDCER